MYKHIFFITMVTYLALVGCREQEYNLMHKKTKLEAHYDSLFLHRMDINPIDYLDSLINLPNSHYKDYLISNVIDELVYYHDEKFYTDFILPKVSKLLEDSSATFVKFSHDLYTNIDSVDITKLKNLLLQPLDNVVRISTLNRIGQYYSDVDFSFDSIHYYFGKSTALLEDIPHITREHFKAYRTLVDLAPKERKHLDGIYYANLLCDFDKYLYTPDSLTKARAYLIRAYILFREEGGKEGSKLDNQLAFQLLDTTKHVREYQEFLHNEIVYLYDIADQKDQKNNYLKRLKVCIDESKSDYFNYNRIKGNVLTRSNEYHAALPYLETALEKEMNKRFFNIKYFSNVCFCLSDCYLFKHQFDKAEEIMVLNNKYLAGRYGINRKEKNYSFTGDLEMASIHFQIYNSQKNTNFLYKTIDLLNTINKNMLNQYRVIDEQSILQFYLESGNKFFKLGMEANYVMYRITKDGKYLNSFVEYSDKKKSSLLYRDMNLARQMKLNSSKLYKEQLIISGEIKEEQLKGMRNNKNLNDVIKKKMTLELKIEKAEMAIKNDFNIEHNGPLVKNLLEHGKISKSKSYLDITQLAEDIYYTLIHNDEILSVKYKLSEEELEHLNTYLSEEFSAETLPKFTSNIIPIAIQNKLKDSVVIVPDGIFHRIHLSKFLPQQKVITYLPSIKFIDLPTLEFNDKLSNTSIFSFSDIETIKSNKSLTLNELPGAYKEALQQQKIYPASTLYLGSKCTKKNFIKEYTNPKTSTLHIATHGIALSEKKEDVKLYFRTSQGGLDSLYGFELLKYQSNVRKVVLSACETGKGKIIEGEGTYSLARYFIINGAREVVTSMQKMNDNIAREKGEVMRYVME